MNRPDRLSPSTGRLLAVNGEPPRRFNDEGQERRQDPDEPAADERPLNFSFARTLPPDDLASVAGAGFRVARMPWAALHTAGLLTRRFGRAVYPRLDTRGIDVMIAETPYPGRVRAPICPAP